MNKIFIEKKKTEKKVENKTKHTRGKKMVTTMLLIEAMCNMIRKFLTVLFIECPIEFAM